jgi:GNAT superfamily N-acetyltransferase
MPPVDLAIPVEVNNAQFLLSMGRAGGGDQRVDRHVTWTIGGSPLAYHNCVVRAELAPDEADRTISASLALMRAKGVPGSWHVGPSMRPADIGDRLIAHGFVDGGAEPGMAVDLGQPPEVPTPPGITLERIGDAAGLAAYAGVLALGFGEGEKEARWAAEVFGRIGLGDDAPWRHYMGRIAGQPVATASLFFAAGVAGIYFVSTAPEYRRRGIGAWITRAVLVEAHSLGHRTGVLGSSPLGYHVYQRLGFEEVCAIRIYEWTPA